MKKLVKSKKGFTLIELVIVIAILAILALILIPSVSGYISSANKSKDDADLRNIYTSAVLAVAQDETNAYQVTIDKANLSSASDAEKGTLIIYINSKTNDVLAVSYKGVVYDGSQIDIDAPTTTDTITVEKIEKP